MEYFPIGSLAGCQAILTIDMLGFRCWSLNAKNSSNKTENSNETFRINSNETENSNGTHRIHSNETENFGEFLGIFADC